MWLELGRLRLCGQGRAVPPLPLVPPLLTTSLCQPFASCYEGSESTLCLYQPRSSCLVAPTLSCPLGWRTVGQPGHVFCYLPVEDPTPDLPSFGAFLRSTVAKWLGWKGPRIPSPSTHPLY